MARNDTRDRWQMLFWEWVNSGQSITDFCRTKGLKASSFGSAIRRNGFSKDLGQPKNLPTGFTKVSLPKPLTEQSCRCVIESPTGLRAVFESLEISTLRSLLLFEKGGNDVH